MADTILLTGADLTPASVAAVAGACARAPRERLAARLAAGALELPEPR